MDMWWWMYNPNGYLWIYDESELYTGVPCWAFGDTYV
jgi:hypothetical protein